MVINLGNSLVDAFGQRKCEKWEDEASRERLLDIVRLTESEPEMMGMSPHFLVVARK